MANNNVKEMSIDMGNGMIAMACYDDKRNIKVDHVQATYMQGTGLGSDFITIKDESICIGTGTTPLCSTDKTEREYIAHQILYCAYKLLGAGNHYIKLATGLPVATYKNKDKKDKFESYIKSLGPITGIVASKEVTVNLTDVKIMCEGFHALRTIEQYIEEDRETVLLDIGQKTSDILVINAENKRIKIKDYLTLDIALSEIYSELSSVIYDATGVTETNERLDMLLRSKYSMVDGRNASIDVHTAIKDERVSNVTIKLLNQLESRIGQLTRYSIVMIGGGSDKAIESLSEADYNKYLRTNKDIESDIRYYANVKGYLLNL